MLLKMSLILLKSKRKGRAILTFIFQVTYFHFILVLYKVVNIFLFFTIIAQIFLKMLLKIVRFLFKFYLNRGLYHLIFHKIFAQPIDMTRVRPPKEGCF